MRENGSFEVKVGNKTIRHYFSNEAHSGWATGFNFDKTLILQIGKEARGLKLAKTRAYIVIDEDDNGPVVETWVIRNLTFWRA